MFWSREVATCAEIRATIRGSSSPDCMVAFGVDPVAIVARNGYVTGEVGKPPDLVFEVGSSIKGRQDYTVKRDAYLGHGVPEYWCFDPTGGRYHVSALAGDVLVDGEYRPMEIAHEPDGLIWAHIAVLGLDLCWDAGDLRFRDPSGGEFLLTPHEQRVGRLEAESRAEAETARACGSCRCRGPQAEGTARGAWRYGVTSVSAPETDVGPSVMKPAVRSAESPFLVEVQEYRSRRSAVERLFQRPPATRIHP